jgi:hypothetical protein
MHQLWLAFLLGFGGSIAATFVAVAVGLAAMPGVYIAVGRMTTSESKARAAVGVPLACVGAAYAALAWVIFVVSLAHAWISASHGPGKWILWTTACWVAMAPPSYVVTAIERENRGQKMDANFILVLRSLSWVVFISFLGFFVFAFSSAAGVAWSWVPRIAAAI